ncbi:hypothetical protein SRHO_G00090440 [Serrasalmus rhombeus]
MESELDCLTSSGREFPSLGADLEKARSPKPWSKPMETLENRGNVMMCAREETGGRVLNHVRFVNGGRADSR